MPVLIERELVHDIVGAFYEVYNYYGFGLTETVYSNALALELSDRRHHVTRELRVDIEYKGRRICWQRLDLVVDNTIIVEIKTGEDIPRGAARQLVNYLRATSFEVGLLCHFGLEPRFERFIDSPKRRVVGHWGEARHSQR